MKISTFTKKLKLIKPDQDDFYNVDDFNQNADILDENIISKSAMLTDEDINDIKSEGFYYGGVDNTCKNLPVTGAFSLTVLPCGVNYFVQICIVNSYEYIRFFNSENWSRWRNSANDGNADTLDGFDATAFERAFTKNTAFNKNFGTAVGTVCQGNDPRLSDARTAKGGSADTAKYTGNATLTAFSLKNICMSTADPSGGKSGDVWIKYE